MHNQQREPQSYEDCQENQFKNLGELHKEGKPQTFINSFNIRIVR